MIYDLTMVCMSVKLVEMLMVSIERTSAKALFAIGRVIGWILNLIPFPPYFIRIPALFSFQAQLGSCGRRFCLRKVLAHDKGIAREGESYS